MKKRGNGEAILCIYLHYFWKGFGKNCLSSNTNCEAMHIWNESFWIVPHFHTNPAMSRTLSKYPKITLEVGSWEITGPYMFLNNLGFKVLIWVRERSQNARKYGLWPYPVDPPLTLTMVFLFWIFFLKFFFS